METIQSENDTENGYNVEHQNDSLEQNYLICTNILQCGVSTNSKVLHLGSGYKNSLLFRYFNELKLREMVDFENFEYTGVDVDSGAIHTINELNKTNETIKNFSSFNKSGQEFLDEHQYNYEWTIVTGLFDKNSYGGERQFEFIDKFLSKCMQISSDGVIFTFDSSKEKENESELYQSIDIISYVEYASEIYSISKITKQDYIFCIKHSL